MRNKLKSTNCCKIFQYYFTGHLDLFIKLCTINIESSHFTSIDLSTYEHARSVMHNQTQILADTFNELDNETHQIIANSYIDDGQTDFNIYI